MTVEMDADQIMANIEEFGSADGKPEQEGNPDELSSEPPQESTEPSAFSFKTMEDLLQHQLEYNADGKTIKEDLASILKRASLGYHSAQRMNELKTKETEWGAKIQAAQESTDRWSKFDDYAKQNPEWYDHWQNAYENRNSLAGNSSPDGDDQLDSRLQSILDQKLAPIQEHWQGIEQQKQRDALANEDRELESQIQKIRKEHSDIDFDATSPEDGKSLEYKVLEFGSQHGIKDFNVAFKAFYHDQLVTRASERTKDALAKETQANAKKGIIGQRSTPASTATPNMRGRSWEDARNMASNFLGLKS